MRPSRLHRALPYALALVLLAGCGQRATGDIAAPAASVPAAATPALRCMPTTLVTLRLPRSEGFALPPEGEPANAPTVDCVLSLFGNRPLKSPVAFDRAYAPVFAFHEEDGTRSLAALPREAVHLYRLGDVGGASAWLLRVDTGVEMEGSRYDVLFTTDRASGALVDQLLVGAMGVMYRRDYDIDAADAFAIREDTGREDTAGPGYRARYRILDDGRFTLALGQVLPAQGAPPSPAEATGPLSGISLETLPGAFGALAPIRALLFDGGDVEEKAIVREDAGETPLVLAIGLDGVAGLALYVLGEVPAADDGNTHYRVSGLTLEGPAEAMSAELRGHRWQVDADGRARIALSLRYRVSRPGGDPRTGEPAATNVDVERVAVYDPATGALVAERAD